MGRKSRVVIAVTFAALALGAVAAYGYDQSRKHLIAEGVEANGVSLGGLDQAQATRLLRPRIEAHSVLFESVNGSPARSGHGDARKHPFRATGCRPDLPYSTGGEGSKSASSSPVEEPRRLLDTLGLRLRNSSTSGS